MFAGVHAHSTLVFVYGSFCLLFAVGNHLYTVVMQSSMQALHIAIDVCVVIMKAEV